MKTYLLILAATGLLLAGCDDASKKTTATVNAVSNVVDAPLNYVGAVVEAKKHAEKVIDVSYVNQAIQMFNASEGRMPKTLQELVPNYVAKLPETPLGTKLVYDAASGTVKVVKQ
jgi:uncharacterized lipoprotein YajG